MRTVGLASILLVAATTALPPSEKFPTLKPQPEGDMPEPDWEAGFDNGDDPSFYGKEPKTEAKSKSNQDGLQLHKLEATFEQLVEELPHLRGSSVERMMMGGEAGGDPMGGMMGMMGGAPPAEKKEEKEEDPDKDLDPRDREAMAAVRAFRLDQQPLSAAFAVGKGPRKKQKSNERRVPLDEGGGQGDGMDPVRRMTSEVSEKQQPESVEYSTKPHHKKDRKNGADEETEEDAKDPSQTLLEKDDDVEPDTVYKLKLAKAGSKLQQAVKRLFYKGDDKQQPPAHEAGSTPGTVKPIRDEPEPAPEQGKLKPAPDKNEQQGWLKPAGSKSQQAPQQGRLKPATDKNDQQGWLKPATDKAEEPPPADRLSTAVLHAEHAANQLKAAVASGTVVMQRAARGAKNAMDNIVGIGQQAADKAFQNEQKSRQAFARNARYAVGSKKAFDNTVNIAQGAANAGYAASMAAKQAIVQKQHVLAAAKLAEDRIAASKQGTEIAFKIAKQNAYEAGQSAAAAKAMEKMLGHAMVNAHRSVAMVRQTVATAESLQHKLAQVRADMKGMEAEMGKQNGALAKVQQQVQQVQQQVEQQQQQPVRQPVPEKKEAPEADKREPASKQQPAVVFVPETPPAPAAKKAAPVAPKAPNAPATGWALVPRLPVGAFYW